METIQKAKMMIEQINALIIIMQDAGISCRELIKAKQALETLVYQ